MPQSPDLNLTEMVWYRELAENVTPERSRQVEAFSSYLGVHACVHIAVSADNEAKPAMKKYTLESDF